MKFKFVAMVFVVSSILKPIEAVAESQQGWRAALSFVNDGALATEGVVESPEMGGLFRLGLAVAERSFATPGIDSREVTLIEPQVRASFDGVLSSHGTGPSKMTQHIVSALSIGMTQARFSEGEFSRSFPLLATRFGIHFEMGKSTLGTGVSLSQAYPSKNQEAAIDRYGVRYERASLSPYLTLGLSL